MHGRFQFGPPAPPASLSFGVRPRPNDGLLAISMSVLRVLTIVIALALSARLSAEEIERIWVHGEINGRPVRFAFDTGAFTSALVRPTARQLGLEVMPAQTNTFLYVPGGKRDLEWTEECDMKVGPIEGRVRIPVIDLPTWGKADFEGVVGWDTVTNAVVCLEAFVDGVTFLSEVPPLAAEWPRVRAVPTVHGLGLEIPHANQASGILLIDTGSDKGVALPPQAWRKWKKAHPKAPLTLGTDASPSEGFYVYEEAWADKISFGPVTFKNVPIQEASRYAGDHLDTQYEGTVGLAALKRLELVVDPSHSVAYWRERKSSDSRYSYNGLAAVFAVTSEHPNEPVARVVNGGPAYAAGVRDGDVLLHVDGIKATSWSDSWLSRFELPAGTRLKLGLKRNGKSFETTATLSEILKPERSSN
jgi:hypothetical protein